MTQSDIKLSIVYFLLFLIPVLVGLSAFYFLGKLRGRKAMIFILTLCSVFLIYAFSVVGYRYHETYVLTEWYASLSIATLSSMFVLISLQKRILYAWVNDPSEFERLLNPQKTHFVGLHKAKLSLILCSLYLLLCYSALYVLVILFWLGILIDFSVWGIGLMITCAGFLFLFFWVAIAFLIICENCCLPVFNFDKREFFNTSKNILFNKYFVCMHCHARFGMKEGIDLDKLPNNYQRDYETDPVRPYIHAYDKPDDAKSG